MTTPDPIPQAPLATPAPPRARWFSLDDRPGRQRLLRVLLLTLFAGGALFYVKTQAPKALPLVIEIGDARSVKELDLVVRRGGRLLHRIDQTFALGAPSQVRIEVRAPPGPVEIELVLVGAQGQARKGTGTVDLSDETTAFFRLE